jgi:Aspartyl protease
VAHCYTLPSDGTRRRAIITPVQVCMACDLNATPRPHWPAFSDYTCLWDTGATNCVISQKVVDECGFKPTGIEKVIGVHGEQLAETFLVNIILPNEIAFSNWRVTKGLCGGADVIIGMDLISLGDFTITNRNGATVFSFRYPSEHTVDYVKEETIRRAIGKKHGKGVNPAARRKGGKH